MKQGLKIVMIIVLAFTLEGCKIQYDQLLMSEYEALCTSKSTLNKSLCRETMSQLSKFESDINTYFKEKFKIEGFKLTGIHFPYGEINHGGFSATFQLESDPYVMLTDTFDYDKGVYKIRAEINEPLELAGKNILSSAIVKSAYFKMLPLNKIESELEIIGITTNQTKRLYYGFNAPEYFLNKNLVYGSADASIEQTSEYQNEVIQEYIQNNKYLLKDEEEKYLKQRIQIQPLTYAKNGEEAKELFEKFIVYKTSSPLYEKLFVSGIVFYYGASDVEEKGVSYESMKTKEIIINGELNTWR